MKTLLFRMRRWAWVVVLAGGLVFSACHDGSDGGFGGGGDGDGVVGDEETPGGGESGDAGETEEPGSAGKPGAAGSAFYFLPGDVTQASLTIQDAGMNFVLQGIISVVRKADQGDWSAELSNGSVSYNIGFGQQVRIASIRGSLQMVGVGAQREVEWVMRREVGEQEGLEVNRLRIKFHKVDDKKGEREGEVMEVVDACIYWKDNDVVGVASVPVDGVLSGAKVELSFVRPTK